MPMWKIYHKHNLNLNQYDTNRENYNQAKFGEMVGFYKTDDFNGDIKARIITNMIQTNGILGHCILYIYYMYIVVKCGHKANQFIGAQYDWII